jgi:hypothetical protein
LIIKHSDPLVASGNPLAVINGGKTATMVPVSGGPEAPGVTITLAPIETGDPGMMNLPKNAPGVQQTTCH